MKGMEWAIGVRATTVTKMKKKGDIGVGGSSEAIDAAGETIDGVLLDWCQYCDLAEIPGFDSWNPRNLGSSACRKRRAEADKRREKPRANHPSNHWVVSSFCSFTPSNKFERGDQLVLMHSAFNVRKFLILISNLLFLFQKKIQGIHISNYCITTLIFTKF